MDADTEDLSDIFTPPEVSGNNIIQQQSLEKVDIWAISILYLCMRLSNFSLFDQIVKKKETLTLQSIGTLYTYDLETIFSVRMLTLE